MDWTEKKNSPLYSFFQMCKKSLKEDQNAFFLPNMTPWNINSCIFRHNLTHRGKKNIAALKEKVQNAIKLHVPCNLDFSSLANQCYSLLLALGVTTRLLNSHSEHMEFTQGTQREFSVH